MTLPLQFVIGDVQGCYDQLFALVEQIDDIDPLAQLFFAGDLVNRGPQSLQCLRFIKQLGERAKTVLGNHDLHLLAVAYSIRTAHPSDTLEDVLTAPDREELLTWLRNQPLALAIGVKNVDNSINNQALLIHAGVFPQWDKEQTLALAKEVEAQLQGEHYLRLLKSMYGNSPSTWRNDLVGDDRWRCIINALTRMRYCYADGEMDFLIKENMAVAPSNVFPWFSLEHRQTQQTCLIFGHWSTLGLRLEENLISLDTGCVWGGKLTAVCLQDRRVLQIDCPQQQVPGM